MTVRGWGTVRRRGAGYQVDIRLGSRRLRRMVPTRELADQLLHELRRARMLGHAGIAEASGVDVGRLAERLVERYEAAGLTARTLESYRQQTAALVARLGAEREIATLRASDVDELLTAMRADGLSTSTQRHVLDRLSQMLELAVDLGIFQVKPFRIRRPPLRASRPRAAVGELELDRMVRAARRQVNRSSLAAILLAADAGLRRAEILGLEGQDVLLDRRWLRVIGKGGRGRAVPIVTGRLAAALEKLPRRRGRPLVGCRTRAELERLVREPWRAGYPGSEPRFHDLRRRFATITAASPEVSLDTLRGWMGHSTAQTTLVYVMEREPHVPPGLASTLGGRGAGTSERKRRKTPEA